MFERKIPLDNAKELMKQAYETGLKIGFENGRLYERSKIENKGVILSVVDMQIEEILKRKGVT